MKYWASQSSRSVVYSLDETVVKQINNNYNY